MDALWISEVSLTFSGDKVHRDSAPLTPDGVLHHRLRHPQRVCRSDHPRHLAAVPKSIRASSIQTLPAGVLDPYGPGPHIIVACVASAGAVEVAMTRVQSVVPLTCDETWLLAHIQAPSARLQ